MRRFPAHNRCIVCHFSFVRASLATPFVSFSRRFSFSDVPLLYLLFSRFESFVRLVRAFFLLLLLRFYESRLSFRSRRGVRSVTVRRFPKSFVSSSSFRVDYDSSALLVR